MNLLSDRKRHSNQPIFVLVRFWREDDVWNASALDIPVAVFGDSFEEAQRNFEDALRAHFETLIEAKQDKKIIDRLIKVAQDRGFYDRIKPCETFVKFPVQPEARELCHA